MPPALWRERTAVTWEPLFSGSAAEPYERVIDAIVDACDGQAPRVDPGRTLLHAYLCRARASGPAAHERVSALLDDAIGAIGEGRTYPALHGGVASVGWLSAHVDTLLDAQDDASYDEIDEALLAATTSSAARFGYDLVSGVVGFGVYFLERLPHPRAVRGLHAILRFLAASAERTPEGVTWFSPVGSLPEWQQQVAPNGYYNLGVAHGVPGVIGLLSEMRRADVTSPEADDLLASAVRWTLRQRLPEGTFPAWIAPGVDSRGSRVAWCYGDLGVSVALLLAAQAVGDDDLARQAIETALVSARRRGDAGAIDAGLCHGAAGNAHLFNRLSQATRHPAFHEAALYWFQTALNMRKADGVAGYRAWRGGVKGEPGAWEDDASFLTGASGIGLAFLAATTTIPPQWDHLLLASLDPMARDPVMHDDGAHRSNGFS